MQGGLFVVQGTWRKGGSQLGRVLFQGDVEEAATTNDEPIYIGWQFIYDWTLIFLQLAEGN